MVLASSFAQASPDAWRAEGWRTDFSKATVRLSEIVPGGPRKDGIPSIDRPRFVPVSQATRYADRDRVIEVSAGGVARAYPITILLWHEIVNDTIAGVPIAVTYCPLCRISVVFDRRFGGRLLDFGTTGKLRKGKLSAYDLVMYDRQTESWWQHYSGEAIVGTYAGRRLRAIASRVITYREFRERHPRGEVLVPSNPSLRPYGQNPYTN